MKKEYDLNNPFFRFVAFSAIAFVAMFAQDVLAAGVLDTMNDAAASATDGWMGKSLDIAQSLFFGLAGLEFAWSAIQLALKKQEMTDVMVGTMFKVMNLAFFAMVLIKAPEWIPAIIDSFKQAGAEVSGTPLMTPSGVLSRGVDFAGDLASRGNTLNGQANSGLSGMGNYLLAAIIIGVSAIMVILAFAVVALQLFVALVESYIVIGGGALMLGFLGSRWTTNFGEKYFSYAMSVGVKLFTLYLLIGLGDTFFQAIYGEMSKVLAQSDGEIKFGDWLGLGGASAIYGGLSYMIPSITSSMLNGAAALSMSNVGSAAGALSAAPVAGALAAGAATTSGAGHLANLTKLSKGNGSDNKGGGITGSPKDLPGGSVSGSGADRFNKGNKDSANTGLNAKDGSKINSKGDTNGFSNGADLSAKEGSEAKSTSGAAKQQTTGDKLQNAARRMQNQAARQRPNLVSDGGSVQGVSIRMGMGDD